MFCHVMASGQIVLRLILCIHHLFISYYVSVCVLLAFSGNINIFIDVHRVAGVTDAL